MIAEMVSAMMQRDLKCLKRQLDAFHDERHIWRTAPGITNSAGTLALHMAGNLQHFIGAQLGGSSYVRDRDAEFNKRDVSRAELHKEVDAAIAAVDKALRKVSDKDAAKPFPIPVGGSTVGTGDFIMHLAAHLAYHLGQVDYLRRFVTGEAGKMGALSPAELSSAKKAG